MTYNLANYPEQYSSSGITSPYGIAAGGVIYCLSGNGVEVLLLVRNEPAPSYHLAKGTVHVGENLESAAIREIAEEAGASVELQTYIGAQTVVYDYLGKQYDKTTHYYVARYIKDIGPMDSEHDGRLWFPASQAYELLSQNIKKEDIFITRLLNFLAL